MFQEPDIFKNSDLDVFERETILKAKTIQLQMYTIPRQPELVLKITHVIYY